MGQAVPGEEKPGCSEANSSDGSLEQESRCSGKQSWVYCSRKKAELTRTRKLPGARAPKTLGSSGHEAWEKKGEFKDSLLFVYLAVLRE